MCTDDGAHFVRRVVAAVEEGSGGGEQVLQGVEQLTVRDLAPELPPEHLGRVEPRTVGGQIQQHETTCGASQHRLDLLVLMRAGVVPGHIHRLVGMMIEQRLEQFRHLLPTLVMARDDQALAGVLVHCPKAIAPGGLHRCGDHHLLAFRAPHRPQGRMPADVELIRIVEHRVRLQLIAGIFNRLFLSA